jgi:hypothetical protein
LSGQSMTSSLFLLREMMDHPMQPPSQFVKEFIKKFDSGNVSIEMIATAMYQAGADAELWACVDRVIQLSGKLTADQLLVIRRPGKPKKELALEAVQRIKRNVVLNVKSYGICDDLKRDINYLCSVINSMPDD